MKSIYSKTLSKFNNSLKTLNLFVFTICLFGTFSSEAREFEGYQFVKARHSGKYWAIKKAGKTDRTILWQWEKHGKHQQQFKFESTGDGYYFIQARHSGKYLSVQNKGMGNGVILWQYEKHGGHQQQFKLSPASDGYYYIMARHSGKYISVKNADKENGAIIWQWEYHGKAQQQFKLKPAHSTTRIAIQTDTKESSLVVKHASATHVGRPECSDKSFKVTYPGMNTYYCYSCPDEYKRTVFDIKGDKACEKPGRVKYAKTTKHGKGKGLLGTDCDGGQFWDPNGNCYSCPNGYSRTTHPVKSDKACSQKVHAKYSKATYEGENDICGKGFYDPGTDKCWTCPKGYKRTVFSVDSDKACEKVKIK